MIKMIISKQNDTQCTYMYIHPQLLFNLIKLDDIIHEVP